MYLTIQVTGKNGEYAKQIFGFDTLEAAKANHFYFLASSYSDTEVTYILAVIIDKEGIVLEREIKAEEVNV